MVGFRKDPDTASLLNAYPLFRDGTRKNKFRLRVNQKMRQGNPLSGTHFIYITQGKALEVGSKT